MRQPIDSISKQHRPPFSAALRSRWAKTQAFLCVGLDPLQERLPEPFAHVRKARAGSDELAIAINTFCQKIVAISKDSVCAFKPQAAHFAALGLEDVLQDLIGFIHREAPSVPVILDAKRGDIGSTAERYAIEAFERYDADAVTVNPWLGPESLRPYLDHEDRGTIILCRTSNPDSAWLQSTCEDISDKPFLRIARKAREWNSGGNVMLVAGATYPDELYAIRNVAGDEIGLLIPGIGAQGGDMQAAFRAGADSHGYGLVMNSSRAVLYASSGEDYDLAARAEVESVVQQMQKLREGFNLGGH